MSYTSVNGNAEKTSYISFLILQETETPKKLFVFQETESLPAF